MLECCDKTIYVGMTNSIEKRLKKHLDGFYPTCYTFKRRPLKLIWFEEYKWVHDAIATEKRIKKWSNPKKRAFAEGNTVLFKQLSRGK